MKSKPAAAFFITFAILITGCVSSAPTIVSNAKSEPFVDAIAMTCHEPFDLTRDCKPVRGPGAAIEIAGIGMKIAGSEDGKLIALRAGRTLDRRGEGANEAYRLVETVLAEHQIQVLRNVPLVSANVLKGYVIITDKPAYDLLKSYHE